MARKVTNHSKRCQDTKSRSAAAAIVLTGDRRNGPFLVEIHGCEVYLTAACLKTLVKLMVSYGRGIRHGSVVSAASAGPGQPMGWLACLPGERDNAKTR